MSFITTTPEGLKAIEHHLESHPYLSTGPHPSAADAEVFATIKDVPDKKTYPNLFHWFIFLKMFTPVVQQSWVKGGAHKEAPKKDAKKEAPKKEAAKVEEEFDPFAEEAAPAEEKPKEVKKPEVKKAKKAVIAKSILVFDVKVFESETDLTALANKIYEINMDGLVWNKEPKFLDVAYGIKKLQVGCVIEDDKIMTDDLFEKIETWEDVQSTDVVSMQKV